MKIEIMKTRKMKLLIFSFISLISLMLSGCNEESSETTSNNISSNILANYEGGTISTEEMREYIVKSGNNKQWDNTAPNSWLKSKIKELAIEKKLISEAKLVGTNKTETYQLKEREILRDSYAMQYLSEFKFAPIVSEQQLNDFYTDNIDKYVLPEERVVFHIYKAHSINLENQELIKKQIETLRNRVLNGENFKLLAEKFSDSESRHKKGLIGLLKAGDMSSDFDNIIFNLDKNTVSDIVKTQDGYHIFWVADILQQKSYSFEEVKYLIQKEIIEDLSFEFLKEKAELLPKPDVYYIPETSEYESLVSKRNPKTSLLSVGEYNLTVSQFIQQINDLKINSEPSEMKEKSYRLLQSLGYKELIYQHMLQNNIHYNQPDLLEYMLSSLLIKEYSAVKIKSYINHHPELIKTFYNKNKPRFSTPIRFSIEKLSIPKKESGNLMPFLEQAITKLDEGEITLSDLADKYAGKVISLKNRNLNQLAKNDNNLLKFIQSIEINKHSPPFTSNGFYNIFKLTDKQEPKIQSLAITREKVIHEYITQHQTEIFSNITKELIKDLKINNEVLKRYISSLQKIE